MFPMYFHAPSFDEALLIISFFSNTRKTRDKILCPCSAKDLLESWSCATIRKKAKKSWMAAPLFLFWAIWSERNRIVFDNERFSMTRLITSFISMFVSWASCFELGECSLVIILLCIL